MFLVRKEDHGVGFSAKGHGHVGIVREAELVLDSIKAVLENEGRGGTRPARVVNAEEVGCIKRGGGGAGVDEKNEGGDEGNGERV